MEFDVRGIKVLISPEDWDRVSLYKWYLHDKGYIVSSNFGRILYLHRFILDIDDGAIWVDHINNIKTDNRRENLRVCSPSENKRNRCKTMNPTSSRYKGVTYVSERNRWIARINKDGLQYYLGSYPDENSAARAYNESAAELHGEFHKPNEIN
jgi:hypothetical protein